MTPEEADEEYFPDDEYPWSDEEVNEIPMGPLDPFSDFPEYERDWYVDGADCD